ncbi:MAG: hypothetical protein M1825_005700 [Sarcosagium campestre]|nr:MAG: hypothetical protein M1825_005700 [Sarcosagium campestre]
MVATYPIFGRQVGSHILALATLGSMGLLGAVSLGGSKKSKTEGPPINATNSEEENFIKEFIKNAEKEEQKTKH